ncbi:MAG: helix-turn-helix domain-containing protein [Actinomycetia bacterium]|nr:helix-turn-helix domain-containing protein [Actinomycetes bacterium]
MAESKLTPEQIAKIPDLWATLNSKAAVAKELGVTETTIRYHLRRLPEEQLELIDEKRRKHIIRTALEVAAKAITRLADDDTLDKMTVRDLVGVFKHAGEQWRQGMVQKVGGQGDADGADDWSAEAATLAMQMAIDLASKTGDMSVLEPFVTKKGATVTVIEAPAATPQAE